MIVLTKLFISFGFKYFFCNHLVVVFHYWKAFWVMKCRSRTLFLFFYIYFFFTGRPPVHACLNKVVYKFWVQIPFLLSFGWCISLLESFLSDEMPFVNFLSFFFISFFFHRTSAGPCLSYKFWVQIPFFVIIWLLYLIIGKLS